MRPKSIQISIECRIRECRDKQSLPFDFAILGDNDKLSGLIEFQGEQHYKPIEYWSGDKGFESQKKRDKIKFEYCKANNIPLLIIPYWDFDNIETLLNQFINLLN